MKKILVALDGSPRSEGVLAAAVAIAKSTGAKLVLFRSYGLPPTLASSFVGVPDLMAAMRMDAEHFLESAAKSVPAEQLAGVRVEVGVPWQAVCDTAVVEGVDLVVIGSHGYGGWDHLLGTTASKIVNHIDRSLLVVRPPGAERGAADSRRER